MSGHRLADVALRCYPGWWRHLYADEVGQLSDDLLAEGRGELRLAANLFKGALAERLWAGGMPPRADLWHARARTSIAVATLPFLCVLPFVLFGLQANETYETLPRSQVLVLVQNHGDDLAKQMHSLLQTGVIIGLIAALVGWCALFDGARWSRVAVPSRPRLLVRLPLVFLAVLVGLFIARTTQLPHAFGGVPGSPGVMIPYEGNPLAAGALLDAIWAVLAVGSAVTVVAIARLARVCAFPWKTMVSGRKVAAVTAVVLVFMAGFALVGTAVSGAWGFVTRTMGVGLGDPHAPVTTFMVFPHWTLMAVPLVIAAGVSFAGWRASRRASIMLVRIDPGVGITYGRF